MKASLAEADHDKKMQLLIRPADAADHDDLYRLFVASWLLNWAPHLPAAIVDRFHKTDPVRQFLTSHLTDLTIAKLGTGLVGSFLVVDDCLDDLHIAAEFKSMGFGTRLLREAEVRGARRLEVRAFNHEAIAFYDRRGWIRTRTFDSTEMGHPVTTHEYRRPSSQGC